MQKKFSVVETSRSDFEADAVEEFIKRNERTPERLVSLAKQSPQNLELDPRVRVREVLERSIVLSSYEWRSK